MKSLSTPAAWPEPLPEARPPSDMALYQLPTGSYETRASFAFTGGSLRDKRSFAATAIVSGLDQLQVPIWTNAGELRYAAEYRDGKVFRTVSEGHEIHEYEFGSAPYLGFPSSYDVHGDGSVVVALAGGHTTRTCSGLLRSRV
jgi:hypothetical protein